MFNQKLPDYVVPDNLIFMTHPIEYDGYKLTTVIKPSNKANLMIS